MFPKIIILSYRSKILSRGNEKDLFLLMSGVGWIFPTALLCVWLTHYLLYKIGRTQSGATLEFQEMWSCWLYDWHESLVLNFESGVFHFIHVFNFYLFCTSCTMCQELLAVLSKWFIGSKTLDTLSNLLFSIFAIFQKFFLFWIFICLLLSFSDAK